MTIRSQDDPHQKEDLPDWLWHGLLLALATVLAGGGALVGLLALGLADVPPGGDLLWTVNAAADDCLAVNGLPDELPALPLTVIIVAEAADGSPWGVWVGQNVPATRWEVLPPGYYRYDGATWPFHHVQGGTDELRLDLAAGGYTLWLNRELAASGTLLEAGGRPLAWGLVDGPEVCWHQLALYGSD